MFEPTRPIAPSKHVEIFLEPLEGAINDGHGQVMTILPDHVPDPKLVLNNQRGVADVTRHVEQNNIWERLDLLLHAAEKLHVLEEDGILVGKIVRNLNVRRRSAWRR